LYISQCLSGPVQIRTGRLLVEPRRQTCKELEVDDAELEKIIELATEKNTIENKLKKAESDLQSALFRAEREIREQATKVD